MNRNFIKSPVVKNLFLAALAAALLSIFFGCDLAGSKGVSIEERIDSFIEDINAGLYDNLYTHFHPTETEKYAEIKPAGFWTTIFPDTGDYSLSNKSIVGSTCTGKITGGDIYSNTLITFYMAKDGDDYMIKRLDIADVTKVDSMIPY
ncbi:MAG TPA: hypothetical protein PLG79_06775 [Spirochaetales bacterium]|nr:hypothetical protein [Spirochaetales bacterium]